MVRGVARRGATKVEYALLLVLVGVSSIVVVGALGEGVSGLFDGTALPETHGARHPTGDDTGGDTTDGGKGKGKHGDNGRHGNPGQGNDGNNKTVGNSR